MINSNMALITLRGRKEPIEVPNERARMIKMRWAGDGLQKATSTDIVDLGNIAFEYGQIKSIEMQSYRPTTSNEDLNRPLTPEEKRDRDAMMGRVRKNLEQRGILIRSDIIK